MKVYSQGSKNHNLSIIIGTIIREIGTAEQDLPLEVDLDSFQEILSLRSNKFPL